MVLEETECPARTFGGGKQGTEGRRQNTGLGSPPLVSPRLLSRQIRCLFTFVRDVNRRAAAKGDDYHPNP